LVPLLFATRSNRVTARRLSAFTTHKSFSELVSKYDAFILDQFGVFHNGATALDGAVNCVQELYKAGKSLIILSNASAPSEAALKKLPRYGFDERHFMGAITSGEEAAKYIRKTYGSASTPSKVLFLTWDASDLNNPRLTATPQRYLEECGNIQVATSIGHADFVLAHGSEVWYRGDGDQSTLRTHLSKRATFRMSTPFFGSVLSEDFPWCVPTQTLLCKLPRVLRRTCPARLQLAIKKSWEKKAHPHPIPLSLVSLMWSISKPAWPGWVVTSRESLMWVIPCTMTLPALPQQALLAF
jgi:Haloacid dehalogenase-like hydrolase